MIRQVPGFRCFVRFLLFQAHLRVFGLEGQDW